ncbi:hypothetical protein BDR22DRAFT_857688 [Usnea florida]
MLSPTASHLVHLLESPPHQDSNDASDALKMLSKPSCCLGEQGFDLRDRLNLHHRYGDVIGPNSLPLRESPLSECLQS